MHNLHTYRLNPIALGDSTLRKLPLYDTASCATVVVESRLPIQLNVVNVSARYAMESSTMGNTLRANWSWAPDYLSVAVEMGGFCIYSIIVSTQSPGA